MAELRKADIPPHLAAVLRDPSRLAAVEAVRAVDELTEDAFARSVRLAARLLDTGTALISLAGADRQFIWGGTGRAVPLHGEQELLDRGFCAEVVTSGRPLVIDDIQDDSAHRADPAFAATGLRACLGVPLFLGELPIGALCVIDTRPRQWNTEQRRALEQLGIDDLMRLHEGRELLLPARDELADGPTRASRVPGATSRETRCSTSTPAR
ncbi:GAF domain-containing protein [Streptomyces sp. NPDC004290]